MNLFLKMKAWQIFTLLFALPFIVQMSVFALLPDNNIELFFKIIFTLMIAYVVIFLLWFWSIGNKLNSYIDIEHRPSSNLFKAAIVYVFIYILIFNVLILNFINETDSSSFASIFFILHILGMVCMYYCLVFVAKNLVLAEKNKKISVSEYIGEFFLFWFYPIGVWFTQPRINKLYDLNT